MQLAWWPGGVTAGTVGSESSDRGSNPGEALVNSQPILGRPPAANCGLSADVSGWPVGPTLWPAACCGMVSVSGFACHSPDAAAPPPSACLCTRILIHGHVIGFCLQHVEQLQWNPKVLTAKLKCISREANPGHIDGNDVFYH